MSDVLRKRFDVGRVEICVSTDLFPLFYWRVWVADRIRICRPVCCLFFMVFTIIRIADRVYEDNSALQLLPLCCGASGLSYVIRAFQRDASNCLAFGVFSFPAWLVRDVFFSTVFAYFDKLVVFYFIIPFAAKTGDPLSDLSVIC